MRAFVVLTMVVACSSAAPPPTVAPAPPPPLAPDPAPAPPPTTPAPWIAAGDEVFTIETPIASAQAGKNPHSWAAAVTDELAYLFMYLPVPKAADSLDTAVERVKGSLKSVERVETVTIHGRPARRVTATTQAGRPAVELFIADGDRLFMLQVIGEAPPGDVERFVTSFRIR
jgi:hypothetical protein